MIFSIHPYHQVNIYYWNALDPFDIELWAAALSYKTVIEISFNLCTTDYSKTLHLLPYNCAMELWYI